MKNEGPRILRKDVPPAHITSPDGSLWSFPLEQNEGWTIFTSVAGNSELRWDGYIDLSGYTRDDRTWFSGPVMLQDGGPTRIVAYIPPLNRWDFVTVSGIDYPEPLELGSRFTIPSFLDSLQTPEEVIWGQWRSFIQNETTTAGGGTTVSQTVLNQAGTIGMGEPSASDRLYCSIRIPLEAAQPAASITLPPCAFILPGFVGEENDLVYINRLRRSYELQQSPDVD